MNGLLRSKRCPLSRMDSDAKILQQSLTRATATCHDASVIHHIDGCDSAASLREAGRRRRARPRHWKALRLLRCYARPRGGFEGSGGSSAHVLIPTGMSMLGFEPNVLSAKLASFSPLRVCASAIRMYA